MNTTLERHPIDEVRRVCEASGSHWFDRGSLRFFRSRYSADAWRGPAGTFFVSSERYDDNAPRLYSVRQALPDGSIQTIGDFQAYRTRRAAERAAKRCAQFGLLERVLLAEVEAGV